MNSGPDGPIPRIRCRPSSSLFCYSDFCRPLNTKRRDSPAIGGEGESIRFSLAESARNSVRRAFHDVPLFRLAEFCRDDARRVYRRRHLRSTSRTRSRRVVQGLLAGDDPNHRRRHSHMASRWRRPYGHVGRYLLERQLRVRFESALHPRGSPGRHGTGKAPRPGFRIRTRYEQPGPGNVPLLLQDPPRNDWHLGGRRRGLDGHGPSDRGLGRLRVRGAGFRAGDGRVGTVIVERAVVDTSSTRLTVSYAALAVAVVALLVGIAALVRKRRP